MPAGERERGNAADENENIMMGLGGFELVVVLVLVLLIFGAGRIGRIGSELGSAIRGFRESVKSEDHTQE